MLPTPAEKLAIEILDSKGNVVQTIQGVKPAEHAKEVLADVVVLRKSA